jgi:iron complex transport system substrate-binding protein
MTLRRFRLLSALLVSGLLLAAGARAGGTEQRAVPQRIVSLTVCTDQLLLDLVPRDRIAALSYLAVDPTLSAKVEEARGLKGVHGMAEEVLALEPDLVIAQEYSTTASVGLLRRLGFRVVFVPLATDFDGLRRAIRIMAAAVGNETRGEAMISAFDKRLAAAAPEGPERPRALAYQVNSLSSGPGSLIDAAFSASGFQNMARSRALGPGGRLPLEEVVTDPPDLLVLANTPEEFRSTVGDNLRHPAFQALVASRRHMQLPMPMWLCATPEIAGAVEELARERRALIAEEAP